MASSRFLAANQQGNNHPWRYIVGSLLVIVTWLGASMAALFALLLAGRLGLLSETATLELLETSLVSETSLAIFIATHLVFVAALLALWLAIAQLHGRLLRSLIRPQPPLRWRRLAVGFGLWFLLLNSFTALDLAFHPESYDNNFQLARWLPFTLAALILTPLQISAEELFFRGYLLQGFGLLGRSRSVSAGESRFVPLLGSSLCFLLPHLGNPEMGRHGGLVALTYFSLGLFLALITLADNGLELALGVHAANNLSVVAIANTRDSALPSPAIWLSDSGDPLSGLLVLLVMSAIFYALAIARRPRPLDSGNRE